MQVYIEKSVAGWTLIPTHGQLAGKVIGVADFLALSNVTPKGPGFVGKVDKIWGLDVRDERLHDDVEFRRALRGANRWVQEDHQHRSLTGPVSRAIFDSQGVAW